MPVAPFSHGRAAELRSHLMAKDHSSGLLLYRVTAFGDVEVLIGHMGGPFFANKTAQGWSIPKGLHDDGEVEHLPVAEREFAEEMGSPAPEGESVELGSVETSRKIITIFARRGNFDADAAVSNTFAMEWPKGSGKMQDFPEIDRAAWATVDDARTMLSKSQVPFLDRLLEALA